LRWYVRHSRSSGDRGIPMSENLFAAIDPTCQREPAGSSSRSGSVDVDHDQQTCSQSPVLPVDIHAARRRAPLGTLFYILAYFAPLCFYTTTTTNTTTTTTATAI